MPSQYHSSAAEGGCVPGGSRQSRGIMVLASNRQVLYINQAGRELLQGLNGKETDSATHGLPKPLAVLIDEIQTSRAVPIEDRGWRRFSVKRLVEAKGRALFVQAFAQSRPPDTARSIIVLTMHSSDGG